MSLASGETMPLERTAALPPAHRRGGLLRSLFHPWQNALITAALLLLAYRLVPPILDWMVLEAVWTSPTAEACRVAEGACWAFIHEKARFILFGYYPYGQQWRPLAAVCILLGMFAATMLRPSWDWRLGAAWVGTIVIVITLMRGGLGGLDHVPTTRWGGLPLTLLLATIGSAAAFPLGILLALGRRSHMPLIRWMSTGYIELIRGVPLITVLFMASVMLPLFLPRGLTVDAMVRAQVGIILFIAAYFAEVIRGGLQAVGAGQEEAARSLGLGYWQTTWLVTLPQALRISVPSLTNTCIGLIKDSSLVAIIGLVDLLGAAKQALADPNWLGFYRESYLFVAFIYFAICFSVSRYSRHVEHAIQARQRH